MDNTIEQQKCQSRSTVSTPARGSIRAKGKPLLAIANGSRGNGRKGA
jgi:hypothetical protein